MFLPRLSYKYEVSLQGALKRDKDKKGDEELKTSRKAKKARMTTVESEEDDEEEDDGDDDDEDEDEDEDEDDDDDESSNEDSEGKVTKKNVNGVAEIGESDEYDDEESLEDEDEEEAPSEVKPTPASTPGNVAHLKSALKTPGTEKSSKKVSLSAVTTTTPKTLLKNKTPVTPHPQTVSSKNKKTRRLKFEESDESDEDEENDDEDEEEPKLDDKQMKIMGSDDSEDDDEDEDEEMTDDDEGKSDEDNGADNMKKMAVDVKTGLAKGNVVANKHEMKGVKRKCEDEPVLKRVGIGIDKFNLAGGCKRGDQGRTKRREERDKKSLFVRGLPKDVKLGQLKALHNDILYVRHMPHRNFAWLIFPSEKLCEKAYEDISKQTVEGRTLTVDFCGAKAKTRPQKDRGQLPINPLELFVGGLPPSTSKIR
ncbi:hypothetical protein DINM_020617 [Dirofilaria immitis]|nr:hypothetical protein [Dirofilaria immitis]